VLGALFPAADALHSAATTSGPAADAPPDLVALLSMLRVQCLVNLGRAGEARAITRGLGHVTDWRVVGPFDNERGKGFGVKQAPEDTVDFAARSTGKAREVGWRPYPTPDDPFGKVELDEMLRPSSQALAYLATAIKSDVARECALHLASNGSLKVFVNGQEVLSRKVRRPYALDQDRVAIALQPGWNRIVVKSCVEDESAWTFSARFTTLEGAPLVLEVDSAHAADEPPAAAKAQSKPAATVREMLDERAKDDPEAARLLTLLHLLVHPDDKAQKSARKAIDKAVAKDKDDVDTLYLQALAYAPDPGASRSEMEVNPWITPLKAVIERDPRHLSARLDLAHFASDLNPTPARADELTRQALAIAPEDPDALRARAAAVREMERVGEAELLDERLLRSPEYAWTDGGVEERAEALRARGDSEDAMALLQGAYAAAPTAGPTYDELCKLWADRATTDAIASATQKALEAAPASVALRYNAGNLCELSGGVERARALQEAALRIAPEDIDVLQSLARLDRRAGHGDAADAKLGEVLRIDPTQEKLRRQREYLAQKPIERFEAPFAWDAREVLAKAPPIPGADEPLSVIDRTCVYSVHRDGTSSSYEHVLWRVQNPGGAKALDHYVLQYAGGASLSVKNVRILHADGRVESAPAPRYGDQRTGGGSARVYDLPPLAVGDAVDVEYRVDDSVPSVFGNYFGLRHQFYPDWPDTLAPTLRSELVLVSDPGVLLYAHERNADRIEQSESTDEAGRVVRRFVAHDLPRPKPEPAMPARVELAPGVDVTTYESWQAFTTWWWSFIEKEFITSPEMKAKVEELTAGKTDEMDKIRALVRFVGQEIRYNSWPFGTHGYEPFSAPTIFERRFGDCKDKSILLCQMLSEIGVSAHPVLIKAEYARPDEPLDAALVEHFNHCIAYAPATASRPGMYLDCTADLDPIEYLRADDQGARVLHVDHGQASLADIPYTAPEHNELVRNYDVTIDEKGGGEVHLVDESVGEYGVELRTQYGGEKGDIQKRLAQDLRSAFAEVLVRDVQTSDLEDIGAPARLDARFGASKLWAAESGGASLRVAFDPLGLQGLVSKPRDERTQDLVLDRPFAHDVTIVYHIPKGMQVATLPPKVELSSPGLVSYEQDVRQDHDTVAVHRRFELMKRRIPVAEYAAFQDAVRQIEQAEQRTVRLRTTASDTGGGR
jgi:tetratricopeptide (TPR) repeat protein